MMTLIKCPTCSVDQFTVDSSSTIKLRTQCVSPSCRLHFTVLTRKGDVGGFVVGFTPSDKQKNKFDERAERLEIGKLFLQDLIKASNDVEDWYVTNARYYDEMGERAMAYIRTRRRGVEDKLREDKLAAEVKSIKAAKAAEKPKLKQEVDFDRYRLQVLSCVDMQLNLGLISAVKATELRSQATASVSGLWLTCDAIGLPRLK